MTMRAILEKRTEVVLHNATASIAVPTDATFGGSIAVIATDGERNSPGTLPGAWRRIGSSMIDAALFIESSVAQTFSGGLGIYGYRLDTAKWYLLGALNGGAAIVTLGANTGWSTTLQIVGVYDRLALGPLTAAAVTPGAGTVTVKACQINTTQDAPP